MLKEIYLEVMHQFLGLQMEIHLKVLQNHLSLLYRMNLILNLLNYYLSMTRTVIKKFFIMKVMAQLSEMILDYIVILQGGHLNSTHMKIFLGNQILLLLEKMKTVPSLP